MGPQFPEGRGGKAELCSGEDGAPGSCVHCLVTLRVCCPPGCLHVPLHPASLPSPQPWSSLEEIQVSQGMWSCQRPKVQRPPPPPHPRPGPAPSTVCLQPGHCMSLRAIQGFLMKAASRGPSSLASPAATVLTLPQLNQFTSASQRSGQKHQARGRGVKRPGGKPHPQSFI